MRFFQFVVVTTLLSACSCQLLPGYFSRKQMTDSALYRFLSAVRGGGRGHRELMSITGSGSSPSAQFQAAPLPNPIFGVGRVPNGITHIPPPPKIGAFYITPPERNAPFYYAGPPRGRSPHLMRIADFKNIRSPLTLATAESQQVPPQPIQFIQLGSPSQIQAATNNAASPAQSSGAPGGPPLGPNGASPSSNPGSLQEIIAQAAQKQHAEVLQKEQKAHPNAQITNSQILVPGANVGQQPIFINQFGQPFLAPAILSPGQQAQLQGIPPQVLTNGQGLAFLGPPPPQGKGPQNLPHLNSIPPQFLKPQQQQTPLHVVNGALQFPQFQQIPQQQGGPHQQQRLPIPLMAQQLPGGGQLLSLPPGAPQFLPGQLAILPQQRGPFRGFSGPIVPGNAILGQPHIAILGGVPGHPAAGPGGQVKASESQKGRGAEKEEQPSRPLEAASQVVSSTLSVAPQSSTKGQNNQMTAAIMQTQMEFSEPIVQ